MPETTNIYCDESCHLEHDSSNVMVLGALLCPTRKAKEIAVRLREIKRTYGLSAKLEVKWTKASPSKIAFYLAVLDYFFDHDDLRFRALVVPDKSKLRHADFGQDHDTWYYKMYYQLLTVLFNPEGKYRVYLDVKDTASAAKERSLHEILCGSHYDFSREILESVQSVRSHEVEQVQLCDLLTGVVGAANRGDTHSAAKRNLIDRMQARSRLQLTRSTLPSAQKVNVFIWEPSA